MQLTTITKRKLATSAIAALISGLCGLVYPLIFPPSQLVGPPWHSHVNGVLIGLLIGLAISFGELYVFRTRIRRLRFSFFIIAQTLYYVVVINIIVISVMISHNVFFHGHTFDEETRATTLQAFFQSKELLTINAYALVVVFVISFLRQVNRMLVRMPLQIMLRGSITGRLKKSGCSCSSI